MVSLRLSSRFQFSSQWGIVFMSVYNGERLFPRNATCATAWEPGCWVSTKRSGLLPAHRGSALSVWGMLVALIKSENHRRTKFGWKQVTAGARWRGEEDGGVSASLYLKKEKYQSKLEKKKLNNLSSKTKLKIKGPFIINPVLEPLESWKWGNHHTVWVAELLNGRF